MDRRQRGEAVEDLALDHLRARGLELAERNYRCRHGEVDLVMREGSALVFVEVRYRRSERFGGALESVDGRKQRRLTRVAEHYLRRVGAAPACRFDVVAVSGTLGQPSIAWVRDAFPAR